MSIDERLFALAMQYRDRHGAAVLGDAATLIADMSAQAPDLQNEIRALAAAIGANAAGRIGVAGNPELEAQAIAADIAASNKLPRVVATAGVAVARRLGPVPVTAYAPPPTALPSPVVPKSFWQRPLFLAGIGAVALFVGYRQMNAKSEPLPLPPITITVGEGTEPEPSPSGANDRPTGDIDPNEPQPREPNDRPTGIRDPRDALPANRDDRPRGVIDPPELASPNDQLPTLTELPSNADTRGVFNFFAFKYNFDRKQIMTVAVPAGGWDAKPGGGVFFYDNARNLSSVAEVSFERNSSNQMPARAIRVQWKRNDADVVPMCLAFIGNKSGPDVVLRDSRLCLLSSDCSRSIGCGSIR